MALIMCIFAHRCNSRFAYLVCIFAIDIGASMHQITRINQRHRRVL